MLTLPITRHKQKLIPAQLALLRAYVYWRLRWLFML